MQFILHPPPLPPQKQTNKCSSKTEMMFVKILSWACVKPAVTNSASKTLLRPNRLSAGQSRKRPRLRGLSTPPTPSAASTQPYVKCWVSACILSRCVQTSWRRLCELVLNFSRVLILCGLRITDSTASWHLLLRILSENHVKYCTAGKELEDRWLCFPVSDIIAEKLYARSYLLIKTHPSSWGWEDSVFLILSPSGNCKMEIILSIKGHNVAHAKLMYHRSGVSNCEFLLNFRVE